MIVLPGWRGWRRVQDEYHLDRSWHAFDSLADVRHSLCGNFQGLRVVRSDTKPLSAIPRGSVLCTKCWHEWPGGRHNDPPSGLITGAKAALRRRIRDGGPVG